MEFKIGIGRLKNSGIWNRASFQSDLQVVWDINLSSPSASNIAATIAASATKNSTATAAEEGEE